MGQKQTGQSVPAEAEAVDMGQDESVLILIKHCRDMKQQESRLRFITLLLLLICTLLFIFTICADLRRHENSGSTREGTSAEQSPAYSKQESVCLEANPQTNLQRLHIHLRSESEDNKTGRLYMRWNSMFGEQYSTERRAIVIPEDGFYFVYVRIALNCDDGDGVADFKNLFVVLHKWNEAYKKIVPLMEAWDGTTCTSKGVRNVFWGQLFDLLKGDHLSVWIEMGYELITKSVFGAYQT